MARLALTKAAHPALKVFAQQVINDQGREINTFKGWLANLKYAGDYGTGRGPRRLFSGARVLCPAEA